MTHSPRRHERKEVQLRARLIQGEESRACRILNISAGGARLSLESGGGAGEEPVGLEIDRFGTFRASTVWRSGMQLGIQFEHAPETMAEVVMGLALYARSGAGDPPA